MFTESLNMNGALEIYKMQGERLMYKYYSKNLVLIYSSFRRLFLISLGLSYIKTCNYCTEIISIK